MIRKSISLDESNPAEASLSPRSKALREVVNIEDSDLLTHARAMCHIVSREEVQWAKEFSDAVERYVQGDFDEALDLLLAAHAKAVVDDDKNTLQRMIDDCLGLRTGVIDGKHK